MALGGAEDRSGNRIELGSTTGGDVALHRAAEGRVRELELGYRRSAMS